jgi:hypothetical protein
MCTLGACKRRLLLLLLLLLPVNRVEEDTCCMTMHECFHLGMHYCCCVRLPEVAPNGQHCCLGLPLAQDAFVKPGRHLNEGTQEAHAGVVHGGLKEFKQ